VKLKLGVLSLVKLAGLVSMVAIGGGVVSMVLSFARLCSLPAATAAAPVMPLTWTAVGRSVKVPSPSPS
jgi:hypothetical protein